ncbi:MAG: hypothetical protein ABJ011_08170, partial [Nitratireductor sp.]
PSVKGGRKSLKYRLPGHRIVLHGHMLACAAATTLMQVKQNGDRPGAGIRPQARPACRRAGRAGPNN